MVGKVVIGYDSSAREAHRWVLTTQRWLVSLEERTNFLIQIGFLDRTPRGRVATPRAYGYFGLDAPDERRRDSRLW